jgi:hypothetical protein
MADEEENIEEVYDDNAREDLVDNDEISPEEEAFMAGYEERKEKQKADLEGDEAYEKSFDANNPKHDRPDSKKPKPSPVPQKKPKIIEKPAKKKHPSKPPKKKGKKR